MQVTRQDIDHMTAVERLDLIEQLWDSLSEVDVSLTAAQSDELARRLDSFDENRRHAVSWDDFREELARRSS